MHIKANLFFNCSNIRLIVGCTSLAAATCVIGCNGGTKDSKGKADSVNNYYDSLRNKNNGTGDRAISEPDAKFAVEAADGGRAEVELAQLALQNSSNPDVKAFASMMIKDHAKANEELKEIAKVKRVSLPDKLGADEQKIKFELGGKNGSEFDKAYVNDMVEDHQKDIKAFQDAKKLVHYPEMTAFINKTLPVLQMHYDAVLKLQTKLK